MNRELSWLQKISTVSNNRNRSFACKNTFETTKQEGLSGSGSDVVVDVVVVVVLQNSKHRETPKFNRKTMTCADLNQQ